MEKKMAEQKGNNLDVQLYIFIISIRWYMKVEIETRNRLNIMFQKFYESSYDRKLGASWHGRKSSNEKKKDHA